MMKAVYNMMIVYNMTSLTFSLFFRHLLWLSTTACNFPNSTWSLIMMLMMVMMMLMMVMMVCGGFTYG